ncbi:hypothetical protein KBY70_01105 [Cyanobium sp. ATX 6E8]|uniref:hypothetical protein n=1 Tax=Cyanobium sp. ATX 6E8 TaxID=2823701 RepID=UPI0020CEC752|nr:hypothetical protein [Cyanobium sp. ATX 6E8]MCP9941001.1 hypothetical protein [Cyanobium sp. ATX 6E8]
MIIMPIGGSLDWEARIYSLVCLLMAARSHKAKLDSTVATPWLVRTAAAPLFAPIAAWLVG